MARRRHRRPSESGIALLIALVTITLVTISVMQFTQNRQVDYRRTAHWLQAKQAQLYADDSIAFARVVLTLDLISDRFRGANADAFTQSEIWSGFCQPMTPDYCPREFVLCPSPPLHDYVEGQDADPESSVALLIDDMSGRYNLNRLRIRSGIDVERAVARELFVLSGVDPDLIGPIVDWIDRDNELYRYGAGAEDPQYDETTPRYSPRNNELESLRELALVKGVKHEDLIRLRPHVATLPSDGGNAININTAPRVLLRALRALDPAMGDESLIAAIVAERCREPFTDATNLTLRIPQFPERINTPDWIRFSSNYFQVLSTAKVDEVYQSVEALLHRTDQGIRVVYYLARRGPVIPGVDLSEPAPRGELDFLGARRIGAF